MKKKKHIPHHHLTPKGGRVASRRRALPREIITARPTAAEGLRGDESFRARILSTRRRGA